MTGSSNSRPWRSRLPDSSSGTSGLRWPCSSPDLAHLHQRRAVFPQPRTSTGQILVGLGIVAPEVRWTAQDHDRRQVRQAGQAVPEPLPRGTKHGFNSTAGRRSMTTITLGAPSSTEGSEELTGRGLLPVEGHGRPDLVEGPRLYRGSATSKFHRGSSPTILISTCAIFGPDATQGANTKPVMPAVFGFARLFPLVSTLALALLMACSLEVPTEKLRSGRTDPNPATTRHQAADSAPGPRTGANAADRTGNGREALIALFNATDEES